ncbi:MAG TPA: hypothetical protein VG675_21970 [Bryobacteraceae bacterium]|nr:hypothetical protein [Bryobacteraceae bacterium]
MELSADPYESAKVAGLRHVRDDGPAIVRKRCGRGFVYIGRGGRAIKDEETLARIRSLAIPPAWENVRICPIPSGHLQAIGRDARGRKQYRYHPRYREVREATKFTRMAAFGAALPGIRRRVRRDLALPGLPRNKVLAALVHLLELTCIRVGNEEYVRENGSFGLTTLRDRHVKIEGSRIQFHFNGKSGIVHDVAIADKRLAEIVKNCRRIRGRVLFQYPDEEGVICRAHSEDVNAYLREITGGDFTAKDFRTWIATGQAILELEALGACRSARQAKKNIVSAIKAVAGRLGNRPATCRKHYVHPAVLNAYTEGTLFSHLGPRGNRLYHREELTVIKLLSGYKAEPFTHRAHAA